MYFAVHYHDFVSLANRVIEDEDLYEMSDLNRYHKTINDCTESFDGRITSKEQLADVFGEYIHGNALNAEQIWDIKKALESVHCIFLYENENYVVFTIDGMIDNEYGILYSKTGHPPGLGEPIDPYGFTVIWMSRLRDHWYFWATT